MLSENIAMTMPQKVIVIGDVIDRMNKLSESDDASQDINYCPNPD